MFFGRDPDHHVDPGILKEFFHCGIWALDLGLHSQSASVYITFFGFFFQLHVWYTEWISAELCRSAYIGPIALQDGRPHIFLPTWNQYSRMRILRVFFKIQKRDFLRFLEITCQKM